MSELDLVTAGRVNVDIYGDQDDAPLETVSTFSKYLGGSAANICVGAARLGLRTALLSRVGDDGFGRFVRNTLELEGVDTSLLQVDPDRLTSLVALALREVDEFPRLFFYNDTADLAVESDKIGWDKLATAKCVLLTGTYLSRPALRSMTQQLLALKAEGNPRIGFDIDFRPVLWGLVPPGQGATMDGRSDDFTAAFRACAPHCDLIVGTESEFRAAAGEDSATRAIHNLRQLTSAVLVVKRGHRGCVYYDVDAGAEEKVTPGFPIDPVNTVGAGDGFFAAFLTRWLEGADLEECARWGNAGGAIVATRRGCTPAMPSRAEIEYFLDNLAGRETPQRSRQLNELHVGVGRRQPQRDTFVLAFDHRWQLEEAAEPLGATHRIQEFKEIVYEAFRTVAATRDDVGILIDDKYGSAVLARATGQRLWLGRALDVPRSYPLRLMGGNDVVGHIMRWPHEQVIKVLAYCHRNDPAELWADQLDALERLDHACSLTEHEYLIELQPSPGAAYEGSDLPDLLGKLYRHGLRPAWWKLPPSTDEHVWVAAADVLREHDDSCRGILILGQGSSPEVILNAFRACAPEPLCRGFAVGRSLFIDEAIAWFSNEIEDLAAVDAISSNFEQLASAWEQLRGGVISVG